MRFFDVDVDVAVCRDDVLAVLNLLDGTIAPLQTLCDSPRESKQNDQALEMVVETRRCIAEILVTAPDLTHEESEEAVAETDSPASRL